MGRVEIEAVWWLTTRLKGIPAPLMGGVFPYTYRRNDYLNWIRENTLWWGEALSSPWSNAIGLSCYKPQAHEPVTAYMAAQHIQLPCTATPTVIWKNTKSNLIETYLFNNLPTAFRVVVLIRFYLHAFDLDHYAQILMRLRWNVLQMDQFSLQKSMRRCTASCISKCEANSISEFPSPAEYMLYPRNR